MAKNSLPRSSKPRKDIDRMSSTELRGKRNQLLSERTARYEQPVEAAKPVKATRLPTKRMTKAVAIFDGMTDSEQLDSLRAMW